MLHIEVACYQLSVKLNTYIDFVMIGNDGAKITVFVDQASDRDWSKVIPVKYKGFDVGVERCKTDERGFLI
jgi:hypothetical protein